VRLLLLLTLMLAVGCGDYPDSTSYPDEGAPMTEVGQ